MNSSLLNMQTKVFFFKYVFTFLIFSEIDISHSSEFLD